MSVEAKCSQWIYNLIELALRKKHTRVIRICDHLESQGITSHEIMVIKSYSISQVKGAKQAMQLLDPFHGALVNTAKVQYQQSVGDYHNAQQYLSTISNSQGDSLMDCLNASNQFMGDSEGSNISNILSSLEGKHYKFILNKSEAEIVSQINRQTQLFHQAKRQRQSNLTDARTFHRKCDEILHGYRSIEELKQARGKVRDILSSYILFLQQLLQNP